MFGSFTRYEILCFLCIFQGRKVAFPLSRAHLVYRHVPTPSDNFPKAFFPSGLEKDMCRVSDLCHVREQAQMRSESNILSSIQYNLKSHDIAIVI